MQWKTVKATWASHSLHLINLFRSKDRELQSWVVTRFVITQENNKAIKYFFYPTDCCHRACAKEPTRLFTKIVSNIGWVDRDFLIANFACFISQPQIIWGEIKTFLRSFLMMKNAV